MNEDVRAWVEKARSDLQNIENNLAAETIPWDTVAYHAQQVVEKMLKALCLAVGKRPPRIHDLEALHETVRESVPHLRMSSDELDLITRYGVSARYPGSEWIDDETGADLAARARRIMGELLSFLEDLDS